MAALGSSLNCAQTVRAGELSLRWVTASIQP